MGWLGDSSHRGQGCQVWTAVGLPPWYPQTRGRQKLQKTTRVQSPFTTLGQETRWTYSTMLPSPHCADRQTDIERWLCGAVCLSGQLCGLPVLKVFSPVKYWKTSSPSPEGRHSVLLTEQWNEYDGIRTPVELLWHNCYGMWQEWGRHTHSDQRLLWAPSERIAPENSLQIVGTTCTNKQLVPKNFTERQM